MKRTVKALQDLYVKLGGNLTDTYANIADGIKVGLYKRIPDIIEAVKEKASGGGGGAGLPEVTAADNGDVLTVVEGAWAKSAPSGAFDIKFITTYDETTGDPIYSCNKTLAEIKAEYQANGYGNMRVTLDNAGFFFNSIELDEYFPANEFNVQFADASIEGNELHLYKLTLAIDPQTQEDVITVEYKGYMLTPSE